MYAHLCGDTVYEYSETYYYSTVTKVSVYSGLTITHPPTLLHLVTWTLLVYVCCHHHLAWLTHLASNRYLLQRLHRLTMHFILSNIMLLVINFQLLCLSLPSTTQSMAIHYLRLMHWLYYKHHACDAWRMYECCNMMVTIFFFVIMMRARKAISNFRISARFDEILVSSPHL